MYMLRYAFLYCLLNNMRDTGKPILTYNTKFSSTGCLRQQCSVSRTRGYLLGSYHAKSFVFLKHNSCFGNDTDDESSLLSFLISNKSFNLDRFSSTMKLALLTAQLHLDEWVHVWNHFEYKTCWVMAILAAMLILAFVTDRCASSLSITQFPLGVCWYHHKP